MPASHFNPPPQYGNNYYSMYPNILGHLSGKLSKKPHYSTAANTKKKSKTAILYTIQVTTILISQGVLKKCNTKYLKGRGEAAS